MRGLKLNIDGNINELIFGSDQLNAITGEYTGNSSKWIICQRIRRVRMTHFRQQSRRGQ